MIKIDPSGDYVQLKYVDTINEYVQEELKSDSDAIEYSSSSNGKIYLKFGRMTFEYFEPTEFEINGSAVTDAADFIIKLTALFSGGGGASGIDSVLAIGQALTDDREINLNGHDLTITTLDFPTGLFYIDDEDGIVWLGDKAENLYIRVDETQQIIIIASPSNEIHGHTTVSGGETVSFAVKDDPSVGGGSLLNYLEVDTGGDNGVKLQNSSGRSIIVNDDYAGIELNAGPSGNIGMPSVVALDFANDSAAATGGVPVGGLYHTSGTLKIRLS